MQNYLIIIIAIFSTDVIAQSGMVQVITDKNTTLVPKSKGIQKIIPQPAQNKRTKPLTTTPLTKRLDKTQVLKALRPDLQIEIINPASANQQATIRVHNKSSTPTPQGSSFIVKTELKISCEVGKLESNIAAQGAYQSVGILTGNTHKDLYVKPASGAFTSKGCYYRIFSRADTSHRVVELNENNNSAASSYCPPGTSCY